VGVAVPTPATPVWASPCTPQPTVEPPRFVDAEPTQRSGVNPKLIIAIVAVAALIGGGAALFLGGGDDEKTGAPADTTATNVVDTSTEVTADPSTSEDSISTSSAVVETTAGPTTTSPYVGPGASLVASDPLPSGVTGVRASDALPYAQLFADRLADGDWAGVISMVTNLPPTAEQLDASFGRVDRLSLIVLDAADDGFGVTLQLAGVANESDGTTTVRCLRWTVNPDGLLTDGVYDPAIVAQWTDQRTAESVLADTASLDAIRAQCVLA
ncbi:MAG: hypothetical protein ABMA25_17890, partial [Ilumatobacteraceae bacterium]